MIPMPDRQARFLVRAVRARFDRDVRLGAADVLVFDSNHNGNLDATDRRLVQIEAGSAMFFLNDRAVAVP